MSFSEREATTGPEFITTAIHAAKTTWLPRALGWLTARVLPLPIAIVGAISGWIVPRVLDVKGNIAKAFNNFSLGVAFSLGGLLLGSLAGLITQEKRLGSSQT